MELLAQIRAEARKHKMRIAFPEGDDPRVIAACKTLERDGLGRSSVSAVSGELQGLDEVWVVGVLQDGRQRPNGLIP